MSAPATPVIPIPDPVPLPAPAWLMWALLMLTFFLHVIPMNLILGGSIITAVQRLRRGKEGAEHRAELVRSIGKILPVAVAAAISTGVAPLLFLQVLYGRLFFVSAILMGWFWLAVIPLLTLAYYGTYLIAFKGASLGRFEKLAGWIVALIFMTIGFIYSNNMSLMIRPEVFAQRYAGDPRGLHLNLDDPTLVFRYLHFLLSAIAVAGMGVAVLGLARRAKDAAFGSWAIRSGAAWFSVATGLNLVAGLLWLMALPRETLLRFMGGSMHAGGVLALGIFLGIGALIMMVRAMDAKEPGPLVRGSVYTLLLTIVMMILARDEVRKAALEKAGFQPVAWVAPQWGVILIFVVLLVAAIATVAWMVLAIVRGKGTPSSAPS